MNTPLRLVSVASSVGSQQEMRDDLCGVREVSAFAYGSDLPTRFHRVSKGKKDRQLNSGGTKGIYSARSPTIHVSNLRSVADER
jgi:hypothetical protein